MQVLSPEANVTYSWYAAATGGAALANTGTPYNTQPILANTTFYVEASNASGCINNGGRTAVNVTTNGQIAAPTLSATTTSPFAPVEVQISALLTQ